MAAVHDCGCELVDNPPCLFPNMKKHLGGKQYRTDDEVISAAEHIFEDEDESFYITGIQALHHQWKKCVDHRGDYVER